MTTPTSPIAGRLVPEVVPALPAGFTRVVESMAGGPYPRIALADGFDVVLVAPTGLANAWRDADPTAVVSRSADAFTPAPAPSPGAPRGPQTVPVRLLVRWAGSTVASVPLVAALRRRVPDSGGRLGVGIELVILSWDLRAGTMRGPGRFGSTLELGWRRVGAMS